MKYLRTKLIEAAQFAKEEQRKRNDQLNSEYEAAVIRAKEEWIDKYQGEWLMYLDRLMYKLKQGEVLTDWDMDTSRYSRGRNNTPPVYDGRVSRWNLPDKPTSRDKFQPDSVFDRLIAVCSLSAEDTISDNALKGAGFGQSDMSRFVYFYSRFLDAEKVQA